MKLIYFIIVILIIYFIATQIQCMHLNSMPIDKQIEINKKHQIKSIVSPTGVIDYSIKRPIHIGTKTIPIFEDNQFIGHTDKYLSEQFQSTNYKQNYWDLTEDKIELPNASNLFVLIRSEYVDEKYAFNIPNQPVTTRYPNRNTLHADSKYLQHIKKDINSWNELFYKYYQTYQNILQVKSITPIFVMETLNEFVITVNVSLIYLGKTIHFQLTYYGQIDKNDDFFNGATNKYYLQLVNIKPITKSEYRLQPNPMNNDTDCPFMSMKEQLQYVDRINKLHRDENEI